MAEHDECTCTWCDKTGHTMRTCYEFRRIRATLSTDSYDFPLRECDQHGFCAAGIVVRTMIGDDLHVLMIREPRASGGFLFNLPGGKRDSRTETPLATAKREFIEETTPPMAEIKPEPAFNIERLDEIDPTKGRWIGASKYVLFELDAKREDLIGSVGEWGNTLAWVSLKAIACGDAPVHRFACSMLV